VPDKGLCRECGTEQKLTPKNGNVVRHKRYAGDNATGVYDSPICKGAGKLPVLVRPCICNSCGLETVFRADGRMPRHRKEDGAWCEMEMGEAAMELIGQLGAVEVGSSEPSKSSSADSSRTSGSSSDGPSSTPMAASNPRSAVATESASSSSMLNPERPTESLEEKSRRLSSASPIPSSSASVPPSAADDATQRSGATSSAAWPSTSGSEAHLPTPTSTIDSSPNMATTTSFSNAHPVSTPAPATGSASAPPGSDAMFGEAGATVRAKPRKRVPLEGEALALSNWFDDLFFRYQHSRERSMQATIGPSEIGSACMRKIAMKLSQRPEVNFEKDTYAAWLGTQGHLGLEEMLRWANGTMHVERFLIEAALEFGSAALPHGHSDAFDRRPDAVGFDRLGGVVIDWKFPGESALSKMHLDGCPEDYQDQGHLYGYGQRLAGENVERVAVIALPRERGDLSKKFVWVAPYDEERAIAKIKKAEAIKARLDHYVAEGDAEPWKMAPKTPGYLCPYCPFYLANDKAEAKGCSA
jgi:hypothetical protein